VLIADEPTSALDTTVQKEIVTLLRELVRADGMTLIFITHDIALASNLADRIAVFHHGELLECSTARAIIGNPQSDYTKALISAVPTLEPIHG
jgi:peptide/nickel transport system ATP-binding protein